jgi:hypothetical protein
MVSSTVSDLSYALRPMRLAPVLTITIRPAHRQASQRQAIHKAGTIDPISLGVPAATVLRAVLVGAARGFRRAAGSVTYRLSGE